MAMGEESMRLRDTPSPKELTREDGFGFGSPNPEKESLPSSLPSRLEKILDVLRTSCPC